MHPSSDIEGVRWQAGRAGRLLAEVGGAGAAKPSDRHINGIMAAGCPRSGLKVCSGAQSGLHTGLEERVPTAISLAGGTTVRTQSATHHSEHVTAWQNSVPRLSSGRL